MRPLLALAAVVAASIVERDWSADDSADAIAAGGVPVLLRKAESYLVRRVGTPHAGDDDALLRTLHTVRGKASATGLFVHEDTDRPEFAANAFSRFECEFLEQTPFPTEAFFAPDAARALYATVRLPESWDAAAAWPAGAATAARAREKFAVTAAGLWAANSSGARRQAASREAPPSANVWVASRGRAAAHYDKQHNFLVGVAGRKRVTLWAPKAWRLARQYPYLHARHRQARVDGAAAGADREAFDAAALGSVVVGVGDALYVPPFYWHRVEAVGGPTVAINVWTDAGYRWSRSAEEAGVASGALPRNVRLRDKRTAAATAAALVRAAAAARFGGVGVVEAIARNRFSAALFQCRVPFDARGCPATNPWEPPSNRSEVLAAARDVAGALGDVPDGVAELLFGDWVERVAMHLLPPQNACVWLQCVADGRAWKDLDARTEL